MCQFLPPRIPAASEQNQASLSRLQWGKPVLFAAWEGVFSEAYAAFQQSSCCSQHRPGLAFSDEISVPARRWQYNHDMTSCLGARPPSGSCSQMANKERTRGKCAVCFLLPLSPGVLCSVGTRTWLSLLILTRHLPRVRVTPWRGGFSPWGFQRGVRVLQPRWGSSTGVFAVAGLTLLEQLSEIPGLSRRCQRRVLQTSC